MFRSVSLVTLTIFAAFLCASYASAANRPNVVWIMSEDNSIHYLKHFDPDGAPAPNIEAMASHGITFDRAFSNAPVCSVARTTLITSCYGPRIGTQFHRRHVVAPMPEGLKMFPAYLRAAGYYTTNNSKEDYNAVKSDDVWDDSSSKATWKNRPNDSTPFFHVRTFKESHESSLHFPTGAMKTPPKTDPASVKLQPYFPDTPTFRFTRARYHDRIGIIDNHVGKVIEELKNAGELENTFVFYFGDHGGVLPRSKGYAYESGLHVPLVVRVPENFKSRAAREMGSRTKGFVEFVDFGPTVLQLAGVELPEGIDGKPFLGRGVKPESVDKRNETIGYADRFDEKYDLVRTLRIGDFKYIRNFEPFYPDALQNNYRYRMLAYQEWRKLNDDGKLNDVQSQFFQPKAAEALYDLSSDPHEVNNLAGKPEHAAQLNKMRNRLTERLSRMPDLSFLTEAVVMFDGISNAVVYGQKHQPEILRYIQTANYAVLSAEEALPKIAVALSDTDPWVRYWALVAACSHGKSVDAIIPTAEKLLLDVEPLVVIRAIEYLALVSDKDTRPNLYRSFERTTSEPEALRLLNSAVFLNDYHSDKIKIEPNKIRFIFKFDKKSELNRRLDYLNGKL